MLVMVGSNALQAHGVEVNRIPKDVDIIATHGDFVRHIRSMASRNHDMLSPNKFVARSHGNIYEYEIAWPNTPAEMFIDLVKNDPETIKWGDMLVPSINALYTLKMSHRYLRNSPHFHKTMLDIWKLRLDYNAEITDYWKEFFAIREKETYNYSHPKLSQSKDNFFKDDGIKYVYCHDSIHEAVKTFEKPAYQYFKPQDSEVMCSKDLWDAQSEEIKLAAGLEESYVLALERSQIPFPNMPPKKSFDIALVKVCTSITSGWFREYCWENFYKIESMYNENYVDRFKEALAKGVVKKC